MVVDGGESSPHESKLLCRYSSERKILEAVIRVSFDGLFGDKNNWNAKADCNHTYWSSFSTDEASFHFPSTTTTQSIRSQKEAVLNQWRSVTKTINKVWFTHLENFVVSCEWWCCLLIQEKKRMLNFVKRDKNITRTRTRKSCKRALMVYIYEIWTTWSFNGDDDACIYRWEIASQENKSKTQVRSRSV